MSPDEGRVRAAWDESRFGLGLGRDDRGIDRLVAHYREPHRRYHDLVHVAACLAELERTVHLATRPAEVMAALLFHDAVYVPMRRDNETESAAMAAEALRGADPDAIARVVAAIEATQTHGAPGDTDAALVLDLDMSILAAAQHDFDRYEDGVRAEHAAVPDEAFARGRAAFVEELLGRARLFHLPALHERWDAAARENLRRSRARWAGRV